MTHEGGGPPVMLKREFTKCMCKMQCKCLLGRANSLEASHQAFFFPVVLPKSWNLFFLFLYFWPDFSQVGQLNRHE